MALLLETSLVVLSFRAAPMITEETILLAELSLLLLFIPYAHA